MGIAQQESHERTAVYNAKLVVEYPHEVLMNFRSNP
jgi:hypothetical protein